MSLKVTFNSLFLLKQTIRLFSKNSQSRISAREWRFHKNEQLRANRRNPTLEKRARTGQLLVPLETVHTEWKEEDHYSRRQLQAIGLYSHLYQDVYGSVFTPRGSMDIRYGLGKDSMSVEQGNIIPAEKAGEEPAVLLPGRLGEGFVSLVFANPDGHLSNGTMELLHWMVVNIPCGKTISDGSLVVPYLPPVPPKGSGVHRYVFSLYTHPHPLSEGLPSLTTEECDWLKQRTFLTRKFLATNNGVRLYAFSFFQSYWDKSVHSVYTDRLDHPEPIYKLERKLTPRQLRQKQVRTQRATRYCVM